MRYKVEKFRMLCDKWGHIISTERYECLFETLQEALECAKSLKGKKWTVNVYDMQGPIEDTEDSLSKVWLVCSFEKGTLYPNNNYKIKNV